MQNAEPLETKKLTKRWFMSLPNGYYVLTNTWPPEYVQLSKNREEGWRGFRVANAGRLATAFSSREECLRNIEDMRARREASIVERGNLVSPGKIVHAYLEADTSLPRDPQIASSIPGGMHRWRLTKKLLMSLPTGARLVSHTCHSESMTPLVDESVPPLSEREGFWLYIRNLGLDGRTFTVGVPREAVPVDNDDSEAAGNRFR